MGLVHTATLLGEERKIVCWERARRGAWMAGVSSFCMPCHCVRCHNKKDTCRQRIWYWLRGLYQISSSRAHTHASSSTVSPPSPPPRSFFFFLGLTRQACPSTHTRARHPRHHGDDQGLRYAVSVCMVGSGSLGQLLVLLLTSPPSLHPFALNIFCTIQTCCPSPQQQSLHCPLCQLVCMPRARHAICGCRESLPAPPHMQGQKGESVAIGLANSSGGGLSLVSV